MSLENNIMPTFEFPHPADSLLLYPAVIKIGYPLYNITFHIKLTSHRYRYVVESYPDH